VSTSGEKPILELGDDPWRLRIKGVNPASSGEEETLFALSNGCLGVRGSWEQGSPVYEPGTLVNGFHEVWPIEYPEGGYGFATTGQTILYVPDATGLRVSVDGVALDLESGQVERVLDLRNGVLQVTASWPDLEVTWWRLVSLVERSILAARVSVTARRGLTLEIDSIWRNRQDSDYLAHPEAGFDPRRAPSFSHPVLIEKDFERSADDLSFSITYRTLTSGMELSCQCRHRPGPGLEVLADGKQTRFRADLEPGDTVELEKISSYEREFPPAGVGFASLAERQQKAFESFWSRWSIVIEGDSELQQAVNWIVFQLHTASAQMKDAGLAAKGLTGQTYEGHYFWDMDVFMLPFVVHTNPEAAARLIRFRYGMLPQARHRARQLNLQGSLFPWRTINGEEASAYFEAGTAQYHVNTAVIHGLATYVDATGDLDLLAEVGVEMAIETARMWVDLGFYDKSGSFHLHMVTGPDEYTALVDDNAYTNLMARASLERTTEWTEWMESERPDQYRHLVTALQLSPDEREQWRRAAGAMHIPHDPQRGLTPQDARFLAREQWDWSTPADRYPLLLHFHPLVIYRHQVLKQADVVMAILNLPDAFSSELAAANFRYYDPITTGDSSLSPPVQAAVAAMIGDHEASLRYLRQAALIDLGGLADNVAAGIHLAAGGGVWNALVRGFGGFRISRGHNVLSPNIPPAWTRLSFSLQVGSSRLHIDASAAAVTVTVPEGPELTLDIWGREAVVGPEPQTFTRDQTC